MNSVQNVVDTRLCELAPGYLARSYVGKVLEVLNRLISTRKVDDAQIKDPMNWFPLLDAIDELKQVKDRHGQIYRATFLGVKACRVRLMLDPQDPYSLRELDRVRHRLIVAMHAH